MTNTTATRPSRVRACQHPPHKDTTITRGCAPQSRSSRRRWSDNSGYVYDPFGRQTLIPAADTLHPEKGSINVTYDGLDGVTTIAQDGVIQTFTTDQHHRRHTETTTAAGVPTTELVRHYLDDSDNPGYTVRTIDGASSTTRYLDAAGGLAWTVTTSGGETKVEGVIASPSGDANATFTIPADGSTVTAIDGWHPYAEYGAGDPAIDQGVGYGWHGTNQRATTNTGLILMGVRLYSPATGLFSSVDPVYGGNDTAYSYPNDPVNKVDLDGRCWGFEFVRRACRLARVGHSLQVGRVAAMWTILNGGRCSRIGGMRVCQGGRYNLGARGGTTYGNTYVTKWRGPISRDILEHEGVHANQWARHGLLLGPMYLVAEYAARKRNRKNPRPGGSGCYNIFEREAGLSSGGYKCR